jgi:hypothetical protein
MTSEQQDKGTLINQSPNWKATLQFSDNDFLFALMSFPRRIRLLFLTPSEHKSDWKPLVS